MLRTVVFALAASTVWAETAPTVDCVDGATVVPASTPDNCVAPVSYPTCEDPFPFVATVCVETTQCRLPSACPEGQLEDASGVCRNAEECICALQGSCPATEFTCPNQVVSTTECSTVDGEARCGANEDCVEGFCCPQFTPYQCPNDLTVQGTKCNLADGEARCGDGLECNADGFCCPIVAPDEPVCPASQTILNGPDGNALFCGRGGQPCPDGSTCNTDPLDRWAVCCGTPSFTCPNQVVSTTECNTVDGEARCGANEDCVEGFCCPQFTPYQCPNDLTVQGTKCNLADGEARCGDGLECNADGFCCPIVAPDEPVCPASQTILNGPDGNALFCGRGGQPCPDGSTCNTDPLDRWAVCCGTPSFTCPNQVVSTTECNTVDGEARCGANEDCVEGFCCPQYTPYLCPADGLEGTKCNTADGEARCGEYEECNADGFCCLLQPECPEYTVDSGNTWTTCPPNAQCFAPDVTCGATEVPVNTPGQEYTGICCQAIVSDDEWDQIVDFTAADEAASDYIAHQYYYNVELVLIDAEVEEIDIVDGSLIRYIVATVLKWVEDLLYPYGTVLVEIEHEYYVSYPSTLSAGSTAQSGIKLNLVFGSEEDSTDQVAAQAQKVASLFPGVNNIQVNDVTSYECGSRRACPSNNDSKVPVAAIAAAAAAAVLLLGAAAVVVCRRRSANAKAAQTPVEQTAQPQVVDIHV